MTKLNFNKAILLFNKSYNGFQFKESELKDGELKEWAKENSLLKESDQK
ncbi:MULTISPECIES: hypothetical protein [Bacillus]|nr:MULTISPECIES: hypothetical protein [Bacillus]